MNYGKLIGTILIISIVFSIISLIPINMYKHEYNTKLSSENIISYSKKILPKYYVNKFQFILGTQINVGYDNNYSTLIDSATYIEPQMLRDNKEIFYSDLFSYLREYKKQYRLLDVYQFMQENEPVDNNAFKEFVLKYLYGTDQTWAIVIDGHGGRKDNEDVVVLNMCDSKYVMYGVGRPIPDKWVKFMCEQSVIYWIRASEVREIFNNKELDELPSLVFFIACNSGLYDGKKSWRWAFRLSSEDTYEDWFARAFIGAYTYVPMDARQAVWDDLLYYIIVKVNEGKERNVWEAFDNFIRSIKDSWPFEIGYIAEVQKYVPGEGYKREYITYNDDAIIKYYYAGSADVYIDPTIRDRIITFARESLIKYLPYLGERLVKYINSIDVKKVSSNELMDKYRVTFILDSNIFPQGRLINIHIGLFKPLNMLYTSSIKVSIGLERVSKQFINDIDWLVFVEERNMLREINDTLKSYGLEVQQIVHFNYTKPEYEFQWMWMESYVNYNDSRVSLTLYDVDDPMFELYVHYDNYNDKSFSLTMTTNYDLIIELLKYGYSFKKSNISINDIISKYSDYKELKFVKVYIIGNDSFTPYYYNFTKVCHCWIEYFGEIEMPREICYPRIIAVNGITGQLLIREYDYISSTLLMKNDSSNDNTSATNETNESYENLQRLSMNNTSNKDTGFVSSIVSGNNTRKVNNTTNAINTSLYGIATVVIAALLTLLASLIVIKRK